MKKRQYVEGQWFAVPLLRGGYGLGIIVRGSFKTKGGLGYFFGPKYEEVPDDKDTWENQPQDALLITRFGDLGIVSGKWPLVQSTRPFYKEEWPIPKFGIEVPFPHGKGFVREYEQNQKGELVCIRDNPVDASAITQLPRDAVLGSGAVEIRLSFILEGD